MHYTENVLVVKMKIFTGKILIFFIFAKNIDFIEYQQSIFLSKNKKNRYTSAYPSFAI